MKRLVLVASWAGVAAAVAACSLVLGVFVLEWVARLVMLY